MRQLIGVEHYGGQRVRDALGAACLQVLLSSLRHQVARVQGGAPHEVEQSGEEQLFLRQVERVGGAGLAVTLLAHHRSHNREYVLHLLRRSNDGLMLQHIVDEVHSHGVAAVEVEQLQQGREVLQLQYGHQVVVTVNRQLQEPSELLSKRRLAEDLGEVEVFKDRHCVLEHGINKVQPVLVALMGKVD